MSHEGGARRQNRLGGETSPYLLQHAENPVDWYPWGPDALERALREDRPILLSVGYAACHWCHVMERESFENDAIAALMNEHFVCIKVDREERPDIDEIYMAATVAMSGHGGWPMTVFLTPDQKPFFAGTYFPPTDQHGRPGFPSLLGRIAELWREQKDDLKEDADAITRRLVTQAKPSAPANVLSTAITGACETLEKSYDPPHGGFGDAPKFPPPAQIALLLREHRRSGDGRWLVPALGTLDGMKNGGIYDHLAGGFARYSTDERWLVPHFEKMLYDNAQLARVYLEAWQVTKSAEYRRVAEETLDYVVREMQSPEGGYYSATDADSEGVEGKYFVWTPEEIDRVVDDDDDAECFSAYYDVTPQGNWEGACVLNTPRPLLDVARDLGRPEVEVRERIARARGKLLLARQERIPPLLDDKIIAGWNGLMLGAMAEGYRVLGSARYLESAERAARFVNTTLRRPDGGLYRTARAGRAHLDAVLEDYAYLADSLVDLYEAGGPTDALEWASALADRLIQDFADPEGGGFFHTAHSHESLVVRAREGHDGALPNPNGVAARALVRIGRHRDRADLVDTASRVIRAYGRDIERIPRAFATTLAAVDLLVEPPVEVVIAGDPSAPDTAALERAIGSRFLPNRMVAHVRPGETPSSSPLARDKGPIEGRAALYVCHDFTCKAPVTSVEDAERLLDSTVAERIGSRHPALPIRALAGRATPEGTARYAGRFSGTLGESAYRKLGATGLVIARFGFGGYRIDDRVDEHRRALGRALEGGINLVDTSTNYADGHSEDLVGAAIRSLEREGRLRRDETVVVTKIGYVQGQNLEVAQARERAGNAFPEMVSFAEDLAHCIHPEWLDDQVGRSLARLGLETVDVCLLHNPEYFLTKAARDGKDVRETRDEFYRRLEAAFAHLEAECDRGRIGAYGVSSNTVVLPGTATDATDLSRMLEAARRAGGAAHRFRVLELPMNLIETGAIFEKNPDQSALAVAMRENVAVLVNRPLNAIVGDKLVRLADPPALEPAPPFGDALERVRALDAEFTSTLGPLLRTDDGKAVDVRSLLDWGRELADLPARLDSYEAWRDVEARLIAPRLARSLAVLDSAFGPSGIETWPRFRDRYVASLRDLTLAIAHRAAERSRRRVAAIATRLEAALGPRERGAPLSQSALGVVSSVQGVTCVLVGMRRTEYVDDVLQAIRRPLAASPDSVLRALRAEDIS